MQWKSLLRIPRCHTARKRKMWAVAAAALLLLFVGIWYPAFSVRAAAGTVYSCTVNRCYAHPVTGVIEDPGGEASYATGQGMAEGAVYNTGIMEVTEDGAYYLTFRIGLSDYTSDQAFFVQNVGDSGWSAVTPTVTANGSDSNGTTSDLCIQVPSENCVVKSSMYVTPMGRDVIFYFYPNNYTQGNTTDMTAAIVTESVSSQAGTAQPETEDTVHKEAEGTAQPEIWDALQSSAEGTVQPDTEGTVQPDTEGTAQPDIGVAESVRASAATEPALASSMEQEAAPKAADASDAALNSAQGLSLSTAASAAEPKEQGGTNSFRVVDLIAAVSISVTISGLILMAAAAGIVYYFRKNWRRWGGYDDEEYDDEDE